MQVARTLAATALAAAASFAVPPPAAAQAPERPLTPLEVSVACGPPPTLEAPSNPLRVLGAQDTAPRLILHAGDTLVIGGGTDDGIGIGQRYFVRRAVVAAERHGRTAAIETLGWLKVVAANQHTALASLDHFCGAVAPGDFLEPFVAPALAPAPEGAGGQGDLDFGSIHRILAGAGNQTSAAAGDLMLLDRGADGGTRPGMRFAVYRDVHVAGIPLAAVGEGVVVSVGPAMSVGRITRSRDAVVAGDFVVPRK